MDDVNDRKASGQLKLIKGPDLGRGLVYEAVAWSHGFMVAILYPVHNLLYISNLKFC